MKALRITIIASGSRGDVEPYLALGKGLKSAGHALRFVTHQNYAASVNSQEFEFFPITGNVQEIAQSQEMRDKIGSGNFLAILAQMAKEAERGALRMAEDSLPACQGADLLLTGIGGVFPGLALAEKLEVPLLQAYYIPFTPTRAFPSFLFPKLPFKLGGSFNRFSHLLARQVMWQSFRSADRLMREKTLGLPPAPFWGAYNARSVQGVPILYGYSPSVIPPPSDWGSNTHVTGYWFLDPPEDWTPPAEVTDFLQAGEPPIFIGFGSMSSRNPEQTVNLILEALKITHQRAIVLAGWGGLRKDDHPSTVLMVDSIPYAWLFPRTKAVVHHGGAGTTAAGLRAGVPSVVIPFFGDQPYWGQRVAELGVGPAPVPHQKLTVQRLVDAIQQAVSDPTMRQKAARLGAQIQAEDGVAKAVAVIEHMLK